MRRETRRQRRRSQYRISRPPCPSLSSKPEFGAERALHGRRTWRCRLRWQEPWISSALPPVLIKVASRIGKLKALGITSTVTLETMPRSAHCEPWGFLKYEFYSWYGFWGPKGMPQDRVDEIQKATAKVLASLEIKRRFAELGLDSGRPECGRSTGTREE